MPRADDSLTISFPLAARRLCAKGAPKLQRGQGFDDLGMVGLPAGHVRRFSRAFAAKVHYFTANSWNCAAAQHYGQDHAFDNLCAQLLDTHLARCSSHHGLCDLHGAYPVQIRYNKKDEEIQATFSLEAVNDVTGAIVLRRIQQLL